MAENLAGRRERSDHDRMSRTLDRLRLRTRRSDREVATRRAAILALIASLEIVELHTAILERAAQPMPTELGTLDAIHLATALLWQESGRVSLVMATHDSPRLGGEGLRANSHWRAADARDIM